MHGAPDHRVATARATWLDELSKAVAQAQTLAWLLGVAEGDVEEARELYGRLEAVRVELDTLRTNGWVDVRREVDPSWLESLLPRDGLPLLQADGP